MTRDTYLIGAGLIVALLIGAGLYFSGFEKVIAPANGGSGVRTIETIAEGETAKILERKNYKIQSQEQLAEVWGLTYGDDMVSVPEIDFSKYQVIAVFAGEKKSAGYQIAVAQVFDTAQVRTVSIEITEPGKGCIQTQNITAPFAFVRVPVSALPIEKKEVVTEVPCGN